MIAAADGGPDLPGLLKRHEAQIKFLATQSRKLDMHTAPESRCVVCGNPVCDHVPIRYAVRAWLMHLLPARIARMLRPVRRQRCRPTH
jgi:hypothetical protein